MREMCELVCHLVIHGRVQGVAFRASAESEAKRLGLHGWVRNLRDGSVEALVGGKRPAVESFVEWAHKGPPAAHVSDVEVGEWNGELPRGFLIERTV